METSMLFLVTFLACFVAVTVFWNAMQLWHKIKNWSSEESNAQARNYPKPCRGGFIHASRARALPRDDVAELAAYRLDRPMDPRRRADPSGCIGPAFEIRMSVNKLMSPDAIAAPASAFFHGTPTKRNGGKIIPTRAIVQRPRRRPDPFFFSNTSAAVRYVGSAGCASASPEAKPSFILR